MNIKRPIYVGIDFCDDYSQVSYYNFIENEPASVGFAGIEGQYNIPTVVSKTINKEQWFAGDEAKNSVALGEAVLVDNLITKVMDRNPVTVDGESIMPVDLVSVFFNEILQAVKIAAAVDEISYICVTVEKYHISLLNIIQEAIHKLGYARENIILTSHAESFVYYALCQKGELWKNDVALFEYGQNGLSYRLLAIANYRGQKIVMTDYKDLSNDFPLERTADKAFADELDSDLEKTALSLFDKKNISTVYLTGPGFSDGFQANKFFKVICDRKKAFAGQNLYVKGACYQAYETAEGDRMKQFLLACPERITTGIELKILDRGKDKILRLVRPGINWYGADCSYNLYVDEAKELEIFLSPIDSMEKQIVRVPLTDFPERPRKATMITLKLSFTSDNRCHLMVIDKGFGEFFQSSGRIINEEILL